MLTDVWAHVKKKKERKGKIKMNVEADAKKK